jgi:hypothetical protein
MSDEDKAAIHDVMGDWLIGKPLSAIDSLASEVTPPFTVQQLEQQPATCLERLLDTPAHGLGSALAAKAAMVRRPTDELTVPDIGLRLLLEALCLWYELPGNRSSTEVAGFALEQRAHYGAGYATIRRDFYSIWRIPTEPRRRSKTPAGMGLSGAIRPEFQVRDIPDDLPYASSVVWVNFVHGVHLAHALDPRLLEHLSFQQLVDLPLHKSQNASSDLQTLIAMTRVAAARDPTAATERRPLRTKPPTVTRPASSGRPRETTERGDPATGHRAATQTRPGATATGQGAGQRSVRSHDDSPQTPPSFSAQPCRRSIIDTPDVALPTWPLEVYASGGLNNDTRWYVSSDGRNASEWISLNAGKLQSGFVDTGHPGDAFHASRATAPCPRSGPCSIGSSTTI